MPTWINVCVWDGSCDLPRFQNKSTWGPCGPRKSDGHQGLASPKEWFKNSWSNSLKEGEHDEGMTTFIFVLHYFSLNSLS